MQYKDLKFKLIISFCSIVILIALFITYILPHIEKRVRTENANNIIADIQPSLSTEAETQIATQSTQAVTEATTEVTTVATVIQTEPSSKTYRYTDFLNDGTHDYTKGVTTAYWDEKYNITEIGVGDFAITEGNISSILIDLLYGYNDCIYAVPSFNAQYKGYFDEIKNITLKELDLKNYTAKAIIVRNDGISFEVNMHYIITYQHLLKSLSFS